VNKLPDCEYCGSAYAENRFHKGKCDECGANLPKIDVHDDEPYYYDGGVVDPYWHEGGAALREAPKNSGFNIKINIDDDVDEAAFSRMLRNWLGEKKPPAPKPGDATK
jgi:hypothetical protein